MSIAVTLSKAKGLLSVATYRVILSEAKNLLCRDEEIPRFARNDGGVLGITGKLGGTDVKRKGGYVYIATNKSKTLYIGVTNNLERRMWEHRQKMGSKFAAKYNITRLVYYEEFADIRDAIAREKELKGWRRDKKIDLVEDDNPLWEDLSEDWFD